MVPPYIIHSANVNLHSPHSQLHTLYIQNTSCLFWVNNFFLFIFFLKLLFDSYKPMFHWFACLSRCCTVMGKHNIIIYSGQNRNCNNCPNAHLRKYSVEEEKWTGQLMTGLPGSRFFKTLNWDIRKVLFWQVIFCFIALRLCRWETCLLYLTQLKKGTCNTP